MKKILLGLVVLSLLIVSGPVLGAPVLSTGDYIVSPGDTFAIDIAIDGITTEQIFDFSFRLSMDPIAPTAASLLLPATPLNFVAGPAVPTSIDAYTGQNVPANGDNTVDFLGFWFITTPEPLTNGILGSIDLAVSPSAVIGDSWDLNFLALDFGLGTVVTVDPGSVAVVPIPPTVLLLGAGLVGLVGIRRRVKS